MAVELPELTEGWHWNPIESVIEAGITDGIARKYIVSASRLRGLPKYLSRNVYVSLTHETQEEIRENFTMAFDAVAAAVGVNFPNQDKLDVLAEVLNEFDDARVEIGKAAWQNYMNCGNA